MARYDIYSGIISSGLTLSYQDYMYISSGGTANSTTVSSGGTMCISSGGTANSTTVNSSGYMYISSGGVANSTTVNFWGSMFISSGGMANNTTVSSGGYMYIRSGGTANSTTVNFRGWMYIDSGGTANSSFVTNGGYLHISSGGIANHTILNDGSLVVSKGGIASDTRVMYDSWITVYGAVYNTEMTARKEYYESAVLRISNGGYANSTFVNNGCFMYVDSKSIAENTVVNSQGSMHVLSSGEALSTTINKWGYASVYCNGKISGTIVNNLGSLSIDSSTAIDTVINSGGRMTQDDGYAEGTTINNGGKFTIYSAVAANTAVNSGGSFCIGNKAYASNTQIDIGGFMCISSGGTALDTTVSSGGKIYLLSGGTATNIIAESGAELSIYVATNTYISGTFAGSSFEMTNAYISGYTIYSSGVMWVTSGGTAEGTTITSRAHMYLSGGIGNNNIVDYGGQMNIYSGGKVADTTVNRYGYMYIETDGLASNTVINSNGRMYIYGIHDGTLQIESGATVSAYSGAKIDFTVADRNTEDGFLINDLSLIQGAPTYTITVSADQADGTYKLAQGASNVTDTLTIGDGTVNYGSITVNGADFVYNDTVYSLDQVDGNLTLTIKTPDITPPTLTITGNATTPTNQDVVLKISANENCTILYNIDNGEWQTYSDGITVIANGTVNIKATDEAGNVTEKSVVVDMIDKIAPTLEISGNATEPTNQDVVLTATASDGTVEYFANGKWNSGNSLTVAENGTYQFRVTDAAGNVTEKSVTVDMIDKVVPDKPAVKADITGETTGAVTVSAIFSNDSVITEFSLDNKTWQTYTDGVIMECNGTVYFRGIDAAGNISAVTAYEVNNIIAVSDVIGDDLDGNGLADVILVHTKQGYSGAWLTTGDASVIKWGSLSNVNAGTEILGTGTLYGSESDGQDIFFADSKSVGAWNVVDGKVTGYKSVMSVNSTTNVLGLGDFNGDGATDILLRSTNGDLGYYNTDGTGFTYLKGLGKEWTVAAIGDLNGDGLDDVVLRHNAGFAGTFLTQENGTVKWANLDTLSNDMTIVGTGDFNGDGIDDVLLQNKSNGWVGAWIVEDGSVDSFIGLCKNKNSIEQIADFNGDGIDDLRIRTDKGDIGVLYVKGADTTEWKYFQSVGKEWDTSSALIS
ncbi:MAG: hypothetical protein E7051_03010 [Lentisphaerae bacterium]|nr:hypothetical protein [Lentisphaerota bacterium]